MTSDDDDSLEDSLSDDGQSDDGQSDDEDRQQSCDKEEDEESFVVDDAQSQVTFDDEDITPGGLNPFSVMLPPQAKRLFRKDLPKPVIADRITKRNYRASILKLNAGIEQLVNTPLAGGGGIANLGG